MKIGIQSELALSIHRHPVFYFFLKVVLQYIKQSKTFIFSFLFLISARLCHPKQVAERYATETSQKPSNNTYKHKFFHNSSLRAVSSPSLFTFFCHPEPWASASVVEGSHGLCLVCINIKHASNLLACLFSPLCVVGVLYNQNLFKLRQIANERMWIRFRLVASWRKQANGKTFGERQKLKLSAVFAYTQAYSVTLIANCTPK